MRINRVLIALGIALIMLVGGCGNPESKPVPDRTPSTNQTDRQGMTASERRVLADKLSRTAESVEGVNTATVVMSDIAVAKDTGSGASNNTMTNGLIVMVGVNIQEQASEEKVKKEIRSKLKAVDKNISQVLVTSDPELVKRINDVAAGIIQGKPIQDFDTDIKEIGKKLKDQNIVF